MKGVNGEVLRELRLRSVPPMKQAALAEALGVSQSLVSKYENGGAPLPMDLAERAARLFGVPLETFQSQERTRDLPKRSSSTMWARSMRGADGEKLRILRIHTKPPMKQVQLAKLLGVSQSLISKYESGGAYVPHSLVERISQATGVPVDWFYEDGDEPPKFEETKPPLTEPKTLVSFGMHKIRYAGTVPAGDWGDPLESEEMVEVDARIEHPKRFACTVSGDSCEPALLHGDFTVWHQDFDPSPGLIVLAQRKGDHACTVKVLKLDELGRPHLVPLNPRYAEPQADGWGAIARLVYVERQMPGGVSRTWYNRAGLRPEHLEA